MKKIALLLALCLLATALPVTGLSEDGGAPVSFACDEALELVSGSDERPDETVREYAVPEEGLLPEADPEDVSTGATEFAGTLFQNVAGESWEDDSGEAPAVEAPEESEGLTPHIDPDGPRLAANEVTLGVGERFDLDPQMPEGVVGDIAVSSGDPAVATVTSSGMITAIAPGDAIVTAVVTDTAGDGKYAECIVHVKKAPDKVSFNTKTLQMGKGETTRALKVNVGSVAGEYAGSYTLISGNPKVVRVNTDGTLKALKTGKSTVKVMTYNGKTAACKVTVVKAPGKVTASVDKKTLGVGETGAIGYALPKGTASQISFGSADPSIVEVDAATGEMQAVSVGKTRVWARAFNGKKGYAAVAVAPAPQSLKFDGDTIKLGIGMQVALNASLDAGAAGVITYTVENKSVAALKNGVLKGVAKGETVVTARTYNGLTVQCAVQVVAAPSSVKLPYATLDIGVKQKVQLQPDVGGSASTFTYATSNKKVATVSEDGLVTGKKKGSAVITITTYNKKKFKLKVNVLKAPGSIALSPASLELGVDETATMAAKLPKDTAAAITFSSSDPSVATVDINTGAVTGISPGQAVITATASNGVKAAGTVVVYARPEWISVSEALVELAVEQNVELEVQLSPGSRSPLRFASKDKSVAAVSSKGLVTGVGPGQTTITVGTNAPEVNAEVSVTVKPAPGSVKLETTTMTLNVGETTQLVPIIPEGTLTAFTYSTSDETVATVSEDGMVVARAKGSAKLTVETHNGKSATLKLTVLDPWLPEEVNLLNAPDFMKAGESIQLLWSTVPEDAAADLSWESSDKSVATVSQTGLLKAVGYGYATIKAVSLRNPDISLEFALGVETDDVTLEIPARTTDIAGIAANLKKIDALRASAIKQIELMQKGGVITSSDASKRKSMVNNAFKDYAFPWITLNKQKYWKSENSEGGAKDFKTDRVYYGMPYISGSAHNREYNVAKALNENRYYDSGEGYYILNQKNLLQGRYVGNDCSCFVDAAIWGTSSSHSHDRTTEIASSSAYRTIGNYNAMRTGDLICKGGAHVVMFLYYVNAAKTKIMIIENGGIEPGTNTVHCMVMNVKWYTSRGYSVRRLDSLG